MVVFLGQRQVQGDGVGLGQQGGAVGRLGAEGADLRVVDIGIVDEDSHLEAAGAAHDLGTDAAAADQPQGHGAEVFADGNVVGVFCFDPMVA